MSKKILRDILLDTGEDNARADLNERVQVKVSEFRKVVAKKILN